MPIHNNSVNNDSMSVSDGSRTPSPANQLPLVPQSMWNYDSPIVVHGTPVIPPRPSPANSAGHNSTSSQVTNSQAAILTARMLDHLEQMHSLQMPNLPGSDTDVDSDEASDTEELRDPPAILRVTEPTVNAETLRVLGDPIQREKIRLSIDEKEKPLETATSSSDEDLQEYVGPEYHDEGKTDEIIEEYIKKSCEYDLDNFRCPISLQIFKQPVIAADGRTYEQKVITGWLERKKISPFTRKSLSGEKFLIIHNIGKSRELNGIIERINADRSTQLKRSVEQATRTDTISVPEEQPTKKSMPTPKQ